MKVNKTNVARLLDKAKVAYELIPYEVDENDLSAVHRWAKISIVYSRPLYFMETRAGISCVSFPASTKSI